MMIFGYGTFISLRMYKDKKKVQAAFLPDYYRVYKPSNGFPYILKASDYQSLRKPGFWGLIFEVNQEELKRLDVYEGEGSLYHRINGNCILPNKNEQPVSFYYPTESSIRYEDLANYLRHGDTWLEKMKRENADIIMEFPDLSRTDDPRV